MKNQKTITYIKDGQEITNNCNFLNQRKIIKNIFKEAEDKLIIKNEIESITLKNIIFNKDIRLTMPKYSKLVLEHCALKNCNLYIENGNLKIKDTTIGENSRIYELYAKNIQSLNIKEGKKIDIQASAKEIKIDSPNYSNNISLSAKNITLRNIILPRKIKLMAENLIIKNSLIDINSNQDILAHSLIVENSTLSNANSFSISETNQPTIISNNIELNNSKINFSGFLATGRIKSDKLSLKNSEIKSNWNIILDCPKLQIDEQSALIPSTERIDLKKIKQQYLISALKQIRDNLEQQEKSNTKKLTKK